MSRPRGTQAISNDASTGDAVATLTSSFESVLSQYCTQPDDAGSQKSSFHAVLRPQYSSPPDDKSNSSDSDSQPKQDIPDKTTTATVPVHTIEKTREILPLILSVPVPQDSTTHPELQIAAVVSNALTPLKDPNQAPEVEETPAPTPRIEPAVSTAPIAPSGEIAFAARITPEGNAPAAPTPSPVQDTAPSKARVQAAPSEASEPTSTKSSAVNEKPAEPVSKIEAPLSPTPQAGQNHSAPPEKGETPSVNPSPTARMEQVIEPPPAAAPGSSHDITVRVPDATERGTDVRFVERGGEIHVSVRTGDNELAQTLRGGLNDFVSKLEHSGMHTEVWQPGSDAQNPQNDPRQQQGDSRGDQRGFGSGRNHAGSQDRQDGQKDSKKPRWVEELETVRQTSKEVS